MGLYLSDFFFKHQSLVTHAGLELLVLLPSFLKH